MLTLQLYLMHQQAWVVIDSVACGYYLRRAIDEYSSLRPVERQSARKRRLMEENEQSRPEAESPITAHSLLMQEQHLQKAKQTQVVKLLEERDSRQKGHDQRMAEIAADLKALGYTYPRKPREAKQEPSQNAEIAANDAQLDASSEPWSETGAGNPAPEPSKKKKK